jgi:predicted glycogen debranching enzyme
MARSANDSTGTRSDTSAVADPGGVGGVGGAGPIAIMHLGRADFTQPASALETEWLVTNGLGGFACGTIAQANTRRYHGLLVASLRPPLERVLLVSKVDVTARYEGAEWALGCNEFADATLSPRGFEQLSAFSVELGTPTWTYAFSDVLLQQRIWMARGSNVTYLSFTVLAATQPVELELLPLCTYRDYHSHARGGWQLDVAVAERSLLINAFPGARPYSIAIDRGELIAGTDWYWGFQHRAEVRRGLDATEDLYKPGVFRARLTAGQSVTLTASAQPSVIEHAQGALSHELARRRALLRAVPDDAPAWIQLLTLAADQFVVARGDPVAQGGGTTVIAGYPWFGDWGRDTMIALPGLTLATGRIADAASILRTFALHVSEGMLPNRFPDGGEPPVYNTVDATLWYFHAIDAYLQATADRKLLRDLYPTLRDIIDWHQRGTRYGIRVDAADGLLSAGVAQVQLTWMDAKFGDWVVTPRIGKAVEINALWHFALERMSAWARTLGQTQGAEGYAAEAERVRESFVRSFWSETAGYLYDVIDGPAGELDAQGRRVDSSLRPNQIFAVSLAPGLLDARRARAVVDACSRELLTPVGLRSLSPRHADYAGTYAGGPRERDAAYHQGTVWSWLLGPFVLAHYRVHADGAQALALLAGLAPHLGEACLGTISEIFDGDAPHAPRGCIAQAWSVAETLRAWHGISGAEAKRPSKPIGAAGDTP